MYTGFVTTHLQVGGAEALLEEVAPCAAGSEGVATASSTPGGSNLPALRGDVAQPTADATVTDAITTGIAADRPDVDEPAADVPGTPRHPTTDGTDVAAPTPEDRGERERSVARRRGVV